MLKLNAGVNRKVGLPDYGSAGASCNLELELDTGLFHDLDGLQQVVKRAYAACHQAVHDELARITDGQRAQDIVVHEEPTVCEVVEVRTVPSMPGARITTTRATGPASPKAVVQQSTSSSRPTRPATASQVKAIRAIAARRRIDLVGLLRDRFGLQTADELGIRDASNLIDELKNDDQDGASSNGHTNGSYASGGAR